jgi:hypothetical protein
MSSSEEFECARLQKLEGAQLKELEGRIFKGLGRLCVHKMKRRRPQQQKKPKKNADANAESIENALLWALK